jgi:hypothetical protein
MLVLPQSPCCWACTADVNQGETRIHVHGASSRVLDLSLLRPAFPQSHTGHSDTRAPNPRGGAATNIGGMPGLSHFFPSCSQPLSARVARSPVVGSSGDSPSRGSPLSLFGSPLHPSNLCRAFDRRRSPIWPPDRTAARSSAAPRPRAWWRGRSTAGRTHCGSDKPGHSAAPCFSPPFR